MAETELTKKIKMLTHSYAPKMSTGKVGRTIRYADEVWTPSGIVDSIRFEDYPIGESCDCRLINYKFYDQKTQDWLESIAHQLGFCKNGKSFPNPDCKNCIFKAKTVQEIGMLITCYEVKITLSDFKSPNGHNFHGNENYYVVPKSLVKDIEPLVPTEIGIIEYYEDKNGTGKLRMHKKSLYKKVDKDTQILLLYNALKKWCNTK